MNIYFETSCAPAEKVVQQRNLRIADPRFEGEEQAAVGKEHSAVNEGVEESP